MNYCRRWLITLFALFVGLAACSPQAAPVPSPTATDQGVFTEPGTPLSDPTALPAVSTQEPETFTQPAYPADNQTEGGKGLVRGSLEIAESGVVLMENPLRVELNLAGNLPTPCHQLAWEVKPVFQGTIQVEVFTEVDMEVICVQILEPFEEQIELTRLLPGEYKILVNGEEIDQIRLDTRAGYP